MKRTSTILAALIIIFLSVPLASQVAVPSARVYAAPRKGAVLIEHPTPPVTPTPTPVEYTLPYPGMLPNNPLYFLKKIRDSIIEFLISDPVHKAEFYILQADKKLNMGIALSDMGKSEESKEVLKESLAARTQAVTVITNLQKSGVPVPAFVPEKLSLSLQKHIEVLMKLHLSTDEVTSLLEKLRASFPKLP